MLGRMHGPGLTAKPVGKWRLAADLQIATDSYADVPALSLWRLLMLTRIIQLLLMAALFSLGLANGVLSVEVAERPAAVNRLAAEWETWLRTSDTVVLVSIDPHAASATPRPAGPAHGYHELGRTVLSNPKRLQISEALITAIAAGDSRAKCFIPRHVIEATKAGKTLTFVICFQCHAVEVDVEGRPVAALALSDQPLGLFNQVLTNAGIPLAR
jgi:hypothetical protein